MTSIGSDIRQVPSDARFYAPLSSLAYLGAINAKDATTGVLTQARWLTSDGTNKSPAGIGNGTTFLSSVNGPGAGRLRDLGKTYISASRAFRKVQLVWYGSATGATFGVNGAANTAPDNDYLTGFIELGWEGNGVPAPVARMGP
jgi:hypothetical protein